MRNVGEKMKLMLMLLMSTSGDAKVSKSEFEKILVFSNQYIIL